MIVLGTDYNYTSFGAQFCLPRNVANPNLSVRYRENTSWGGWSGITAAALTSRDKIITGALTTTGNISCTGCITTNNISNVLISYFNAVPYNNNHL